jgi:hypothetical protein
MNERQLIDKKLLAEKRKQVASALCFAEHKFIEARANFKSTQREVEQYRGSLVMLDEILNLPTVESETPKTDNA